ncbi:MAG: hypothetical protein FH756_21100 [Firmicutes bacterium]|nr:hypothetical protein [Bacillota bacterium]
MLYGERYIDIKKLKAWVSKWDISKVINLVNKKVEDSRDAQEKLKELMSLQVEFAKSLGDKCEDDSYYECLGKAYLRR